MTWLEELQSIEDLEDAEFDAALVHDFERNAAQVKTALQTAEAGVEAAKAKRIQAELEEKRSKQLLEKNTISQNDYDIRVRNLELAVASEKRLNREVASQRDQVHEWAQKAESALASGNEDLARAALLRKKEHDGVLKSLVPAWEAAKSTSAALQDQLRALEAKLEEAKRKRGTLVARQRAAQARQHMERTKTTFDNGLATESNFARMEDKVAEIEAQAEAIAEVNSGRAGLEREFQDMELEAEVDAELAALKSKLRGQED